MGREARCGVREIPVFGGEAVRGRKVYVLCDIQAVGLVPLVYYDHMGFQVRIKQLLRIRQEGRAGMVYQCRTKDGDVCLRRAYETGYWFLE